MYNVYGEINFILSLASIYWPVFPFSSRRLEVFSVHQVYLVLRVFDQLPFFFYRRANWYATPATRNGRTCSLSRNSSPSTDSLKLVSNNRVCYAILVSASLLYFVLSHERRRHMMLFRYLESPICFVNVLITSLFVLLRPTTSYYVLRSSSALLTNIRKKKLAFLILVAPVLFELLKKDAQPNTYNRRTLSLSAKNIRRLKCLSPVKKFVIFQS